MMDSLRRIFSMSNEQTQAQCELHLENTTAYAKLEFTSRWAVVTILRNFEEPTCAAKVLNRFWRDNAASQGFFMLTWYYVREAVGFLCNAANNAIRPSRGTAAA